MDNEEKKSRQDKKYEPYATPAPEPLEVREPPPMYHGDGGGDADSAATKKGKRKKKAPENLYVEVDVDDEAFWAELDRLDQLLWKKFGMTMPDPNGNWEAQIEEYKKQNPEKMEAFLRKCKEVYESRQKNDSRAEQEYYTSEELTRSLRRSALEHARRMVTNG